MNNEARKLQKETKEFFKSQGHSQTIKPVFSNFPVSKLETLKITLGYLETLSEDLEHSLNKITLMKQRTGKQISIIEKLNDEK